MGRSLSYCQPVSPSGSRRWIPVVLGTLVVVLFLWSHPASGPSHERPTAARTPGVLDASITERNIGRTICIEGYTRTVRPAVEWSNAEKLAAMATYGYRHQDPADFEFDHLIPLSLGGAPRDLRNLWPQPLQEARVKDQDEFELHDAVCSGRMTLNDAQRKILRDWGPHD